MAAALGVIFDRTNWDKANVTDDQVAKIDAFFDSIFKGMTEDSSVTLQPTEVL
jgi:hypothetical protein